MGDGGEGLVDALGRIEDRLDELAQSRARRGRSVTDPEREQRLQSLRLARIDLAHRAAANGHPAQRQQLADAIAEIDRRIAELTGPSSAPLA